MAASAPDAIAMAPAFTDPCGSARAIQQMTRYTALTLLQPGIISFKAGPPSRDDEPLTGKTFAASATREAISPSVLLEIMTQVEYFR